MTPRITMADVAKAAGVSQATVSLALSGDQTRISEQTATKVRRVAHHLGYVLDTSARTLRTGRSQIIGFVSDEVTTTRFASAMVRGILDRAEERARMVMMMETGSRQDAIERAVSTLVSHRVEGIIFGLMDSRWITLPTRCHGLPVAVVNGMAEGAAAVLPHEDLAGRTAIERLLKAGHRRIGFIGRQDSNFLSPHSVNIGVRLNALDDALQHAGLRFCDEFSCSQWEPEDGYIGTREILTRTPDLTAIVAANDRMAFGAYQALAEMGIAVPQDISVMSFDDEQLAPMMRPGLTTMRLPYDLMGRAGVDAILDGATPGSVEHILMPLIERDSIAALE